MECSSFILIRIPFRISVDSSAFLSDGSRAFAVYTTMNLACSASASRDGINSGSSSKILVGGDLQRLQPEGPSPD